EPVVECAEADEEEQRARDQRDRRDRFAAEVVRERGVPRGGTHDPGQRGGEGDGEQRRERGPVEARCAESVGHQMVPCDLVMRTLSPHSTPWPPCWEPLPGSAPRLRT